jgi:hypothetical protein
MKMPTPREGYRLKDGTRVPGTTTIISRFKDSGGLMMWAFQQGKNGASHLYAEAEAAADIGTCAHAMVELRIKGKSDEECCALAETMLADPLMRTKARTAYFSYDAWARNFKVQIIEQEIQLVSEQHRYGGTPDAIALVGNQLVLCDWKTSNSIYSDYLIQLAAYQNLWNENYPERPITGGCHLLRFAKEHGDFAHHYYPNLDNAWRQFLLFREAYEIDKELKKRAA